MRPFTGSGKEPSTPKTYTKMNPRTRQATGHIDRDGRMIHRHDEVAVTRRPHYINTNYETEPARRARVLWVGRKWLLYFENGVTEDLNNYGQKELKFMGQ